MSVSSQASRLVSNPPAIAEAHYRAAADPYHPERNPAGYINLGTAENRLMWDVLAPRLHAPRRLTADDIGYAALHGTTALRQAIAGFLGQSWQADVDPEDLVVVSGATAALDAIASALCDPGQAIVVPAPYYSAFDTDLCGRSGARLIRVPSQACDGFRLDPAAVDQALTDARRRKLAVRAVALTSPGNPTGHVYPPPTLRALIDVVQRHGVDLISDEIYAHSVYGPEPFVSVRDSRTGTGHSPRTHAIWGFAKAFALPGLKVGVLHAGRHEVRAAAQAFAYFAPTSTDTQALLRELLADPAWTGDFIARSRARLGVSYQHASLLLAQQGIPYVPASAGFTLWIDLGRWLEADTFAAEESLWLRIFQDARVNILPGRVFASPRPGWFRLCHTIEPALVREGIARIGQVLTAVEDKEKIA